MELAAYILTADHFGISLDSDSAPRDRGLPVDESHHQTTAFGRRRHRKTPDSAGVALRLYIIAGPSATLAGSPSLSSHNVGSARPSRKPVRLFFKLFNLFFFFEFILFLSCCVAIILRLGILITRHTNYGHCFTCFYYLIFAWDLFKIKMKSLNF